MGDKFNAERIGVNRYVLAVLGRIQNCEVRAAVLQ